MSTALPAPFGRYQLLERLGSGGMAEVFKAKSFGVEGFEKILVIKRILPKLAAHAAFVDLFIQEAKLAVRLSHANVVQVFDLGRVEPERVGEGPSYFMAMEYVAGLDLATLTGLARDAGVALPVELALYVAAEVAKGLDHAHRRRDEQLRPLGIVHRDVSPQNVLLSWEGEVKLTDFGIAKARDTLEDVGPGGEHVLKGKASYMSPEQARGDVVDAATDQFSLGTVLYELLGGVHPFAEPTSAATLARVRDGRVAPLASVAPHVHAELLAIVSRAMSTSPADRFDGAGRLYEGLLAAAYSSGSRFGASDLAEFLDRFKSPAAIEPVGIDVADADGSTAVEEIVTEVSSVPRLPVPAAPTPAPSRRDRREASVLVVRFRGDGAPDSTRTGARDLLRRYGARVIDDGPKEIVAVFGLDHVDARDTESAVRSALLVVRAFTSGVGSIGAGVAVGPLHVGAEGTPLEDGAKAQLVAAARGLSQAARGRVAVSDAAGRNLRGRFSMEPLAGGAGQQIGALRAPHDASGRFVGRRDELHEFGQRLAEASQRRVQVLGLLGDQGVGKTRLLHEMQRRISRGSFDVGVYVADCAPRGHEVALSGVAAMLRTLCGVVEGDGAERVASVAPGLRALGLLEDEVDAVLRELGLARAALGTASSSLLAGAVARMFTRLAADRLHVFAWDNAQELDAESADLLHGVVEALSSSRALLVFAARPRQGAPFTSLRRYRELRVGDLAPDDVVRLVASRIGASDVPAPLLEFVGDRAGGHPMFIEELLHEALDSGAVVVEDGKVRTLRLGGTLAVPRPLRTLLGGRVSRLPDADRDVLVAACVLGAPVDTSVLAAMLGTSVGFVNAACETLEARRLMQRQGPVLLGFHTPLLPEVVLADLDDDSRLGLHVRAADAYHRVLGPNADRQADRIAHHLAEAGELERAASQFATSGLAQTDARRFDRAARDLARALELADLDARTAEEISEWVSALSRALHYVRSGASVPAIVHKVAAWVERRRDVDARVAVRITVDLGLALGSVNRPREARALLARAAERAAPWPELSRAALAAEADVLLRQGDFKAALGVIDRIADLPSDDPHERHRTLLIQSQALGSSGRHDEALAALDAASALAPADDVSLAYQRAKARALIHAFRRDWSASAAAAEQAAEQARAARLNYEVALNLHNQAESLLRLGQLPRAYATLQRSTVVAQQCGSERMVNHNRMLLDYLDALNGAEGALRDLGERLAFAEQNRWTWDVVSGRHLLGKLLRLAGDPTGARRELGEARRIALSTNNQLVVDDCDEEIGLMDGAGGS